MTGLNSSLIPDLMTAYYAVGKIFSMASQAV